MLLLTSVESLDAATELEQLLHASGVPVFIEPDYTRSAVDAVGGTFGYRVHVWLDEQISDALRVMKEPTYAPPTAVDVDAFFASLEAEDQAKRFADSKRFDSQLNWLVGAAIAGVLGWVAYTLLQSRQ